MQTKLILTSLAAIALAACGNNSSTSPSTPADETPDTGMSDGATDTGMESTIYTFPADMDMLTVPEGMTVTTSVNGIRISGSVENASPGNTTDGAYVMIDEETEMTLSEKVVRVSFLASGSGAAMVAYSTNDSGNSGWQTFDLSSTPQTYSFEYEVPQLNRGRNDYIGIMPASGDAEINLLSMEYAIVE